MIGPNGLINYKPDYIQPPGIQATCHAHSEPIGFKTVKELQTHWKVEHEGKQI
jgi:hypothetical protein